MSDTYQDQLNALTGAVEAQADALQRSGTVFMKQIDRLGAQVELLNALLLPLIAHADPIAKNAAIASAQVKGERLQEQGPATLAANYAELLTNMLRD